MNKNIMIGIPQLAYECLNMKWVFTSIAGLKVLYEQKMRELETLMKEQGIMDYQIEGTQWKVMIYPDGIGIVKVNEPIYKEINN